MTLQTIFKLVKFFFMSQFTFGQSLEIPFKAFLTCKTKWQNDPFAIHNCDIRTGAWVTKCYQATALQHYSRWHKTSHFSHLLVFGHLLGLKHLVWGSQFITSKVTMPKLTFRRKFHWKMPYFWAFYHSKFRRKIIHFLIECVSYYFQIIKSFSF